MAWRWRLVVRRVSCLMCRPAVTKQFRSFHRLLTVSQVGPTLMFSKSFAVLTPPLTNWLLCSCWEECFCLKGEHLLRTRHFWKLSRDCGVRVWSWALGPDEGAHFHLQAQVCVVSSIQIFLLFVLSVITSRSVSIIRSGGHCAS